MNKKKIFIVVFLVLGVITLLLGSAYALFVFNSKGSINNAKSGNVYLTLNSTNPGLDLNNQKPISDEEGINQDNYYEFSVSGFVTGRNPIIYKISVVNGDSINGLTRFRDSDIKLYLTNEKDEKLILTTGNDLENGMLVYKDNIIGGSREELVTKTYRLRTWLSDNVLVSNKDIPNKSIYSMEEFNNSYYSVKIKVDSDRVGGPTLALNSTNGRLTVNSLVGANLHNYKIFGNSIQDTTTNGNPTPDNPVAVESLGEKTKNLAAGELSVGYYNLGGVITVNNVYRYLNEITLNAGTYTISAIDGIYTRVTNLTTHEYLSTAHPTPYTFTLDATATLGIYFRNSAATDWAYGNVEETQIMLEQGNAATSYEPYGYKIPVKSGGKNLFDYSNITDNTRLRATNGSTSDSENYAVSDYIEVVSGSEYTCNAFENIGSTTYGLVFYDANKNFVSGIAYDSNITNAITIPSGIKYIRFTIGKSTIPVDTVQLEKGSIATPYEPYQEPIITNIYLNESLRKIGNVSDYIDFEKGEVVRNVGEYELTGNEATTNDVNTNMFTIYRTGNATTEALNICTHYVGGLRDSTPFANRPNSCFVEQRNNEIYISLGKNSMTTISDFRTWLQGQYTAGTPVTVYYQLASISPTPITLPSIPTFHGVTHLEVVSNGVSPSNMEIEYYE